MLNLKIVILTFSILPNFLEIISIIIVFLFKYI